MTLTQRDLDIVEHQGVVRSVHPRNDTTSANGTEEASVSKEVCVKRELFREVATKFEVCKGDSTLVSHHF